MGDNIPERRLNGLPLMHPSVVDKFLAGPSDNIMVNLRIMKEENPEEGQESVYGHFQAVIRRDEEALVLRTKIPEKKDFIPALSLTLMSILEEVKKGME